MMAWLVVLLPMVAGPAVWAAGNRWPSSTRRVSGGLGAGVTAVTGVLAVLVAVWRPSATYRWSSALQLSLAVDDTAAIVVVLVPVVASLVLVYAAAHEEERGLSRLIGGLVVFVGAMELLVLADDLLTLLVAWELVGACSWALIGHAWWQRGAGRGADEAFVVTHVGDLGLVAAVGAAFAATGSAAYGDLSRASSGWLTVVAVGVLVAAAAKSAQVPFSPWLFSAMGGPTSVSALLHASTMVAAGAYLLIRLQPALSSTGWFGPVVLVVGLVTAIAGGVVALLQSHPKKLLAASTSAQFGLVLVAVGAGFPAVGLVHLVAHAVLKAPLFLAAGAAMEVTGTEDLRRMRLGRALPVLAVATGVCAAALAAIPPLGAAWSKEEVVTSAATVRAWLVVAVSTAGALSAAYATRFLVEGFGPGDAPDGGAGLRRRPRGAEVGAVVVGAVASAALGLLWLPGATQVVEDLTGGVVPHGEPWELALSLGLVALGVYAALDADRRSRPDDAVLHDRMPLRRGRPAADWLGLPALARTAVVDPVLVTCRALARFDTVVVDAPSRLAGAAGPSLARGAGGLDRRVVDGGVRAAARLARWTAVVAGRAVELGIDGLVRGAGRLAGDAGRDLEARHGTEVPRYYVLVAGGAALLVGVAVLWA